MIPPVPKAEARRVKQAGPFSRRIGVSNSRVSSLVSALVVPITLWKISFLWLVGWLGGVGEKAHCLSTSRRETKALNWHVGQALDRATVRRARKVVGWLEALPPGASTEK